MIRIHWRVLSGLLLGSLMGSCALAPSSQDASTPTQSPPPATAAPSAVVRYNTVVHPVLANAGMVVSQNELATRVGQQILAAGGNAVDASIAVGFALAVTLPRAGNLGGSGFTLLKMAGKEPVALDYRSASPAAYDPDRYRDDQGKVNTDRLKFGPHVNGVPGTVAGLHETWRRFGSKPWAELVQPAIDLAAEGIVVTHDLATALRSEQPVFEQYASSRKVYLDPATGNTFAAGTRWAQPDLAWSLTQIRDQGVRAFYTGVVAQRLASAIAADGGYMTADDLARYRVRERAPVSTGYRGKTVVSMPPVSGGGVTLLQMLNVLNNFDLSALPQGSADSLHLLAEVMKRGAANRRYGIGDPDFVEVPIAKILDKADAARMAATIDPAKATPVADVVPRLLPDPKSRDTTHYSVMDRWGNAVATTYTLGYSFGSGYVAEGTGILLDNQLRNFSYRESEGGIAHANGHAPGKRMMSTMTPTLVLDSAGDVEIVTGSPGGGRIINVVLQVLVNLIDYNLNAAAATHAPRIHQPWRSPALGVEPGVGVDSITLLRERGHSVEAQPSMGSTQTIVYRDGLFRGAADPRRPGAFALGLDAEGN